jgi:hypothetical protein
MTALRNILAALMLLAWLFACAQGADETPRAEMHWNGGGK